MELIPTIGLLLALLTFLWQSRGNARELRLQTFAAYTDRYHVIMTHLPVGIESESFDLGQADDKAQEDIVRWLRAYYDLCSEEFYLNQRRLVDREVWGLWRAGMEYAMRKPAYLAAWNILNGDKYYSRDFAAFVRQLAAGGSN